MVKVTIDKNAPFLTEEEEEELRARAKSAEADPEGFKKALLGAKEIIITPQVEAQLKEMGLTVDELVAMMLKSGGAAQ